MRKEPDRGWPAVLRHVGLHDLEGLGPLSGWPDNLICANRDKSADPRTGCSRRFMACVRRDMEEYARIVKISGARID